MSGTVAKAVLKMQPKIPQFIHSIGPIGQNIWNVLEKRPYRVSVVRNQGQMKSKVMCVCCNLVLAVTRNSFSRFLSCDSSLVQLLTLWD